MDPMQLTIVGNELGTMTRDIAFANVAGASLSFPGSGVYPEIPTWGNMLRDGQRLIQRAWSRICFHKECLFRHDAD